MLFQVHARPSTSYFVSQRGPTALYGAFNLPNTSQTALIMSQFRPFPLVEGLLSTDLAPFDLLSVNSF